MARWVQGFVERAFGPAIKRATERQVRTQVAEIKRGLMDRYQEHAHEGQESESPVDELLERYALQPLLRGAVDKVAKIVAGCQWTISLRDGFAEVPQQRAYLEDLFDHPNGREPFSNTLQEMVVRLKVVGENYLEWIYADGEALDQQLPTVSKSLFRQMLVQENARCKGAVPEARIKALGDQAVKAAGDAIALRKQMPIGFKVLQGTVNPIVDRHGAFSDPERAFVQIIATGERAWFAEKDVLWIKGPNPLGGAHALAPFESLRFVDDVDQMIQVYKHSYLHNRATPDGLMTVKNPKKGELERIQLELDTRHKGPEHAGRTYVIGVDNEGGADYKAMGSTPIDIEPEHAPRYRRELMLSVANVPGGKLGFTDSVNRANMEQQDKALLEEEVQPLADLIADGFNQFFRDELAIEAYELRFSQADLRTETQKNTVRRDRLELGLETINDLLEAEHGADARVEGGDIRLVRVQGITLMFAKDQPPRILSATGAVPLIPPEPTEPKPADADAPPTTEPPPAEPGKKSLLERLRSAREKAIR
ncbi:MAG: phage portal protein [Armatimonadota bacterium]